MKEHPDTKEHLWLVKDTDGYYVTIRADDWEVGGNGLIFKLGGERVAHFIRWASYWRLPG